MAILEVKEIHEREGEVQLNQDRSYTRTFRVYTDSQRTEQFEVLTAEGLPLLGTPYVIAPGILDLRCIVRRRRCSVDQNDPRLWLVRVEYATKAADPSDPAEQPDNPEDPILRPPEVSWTHEPYQRVVERDIEGNPLVNSAGQPFDPLPTADDNRLTLVISRFEQVYDKREMLKFVDAVNDDPFQGFDPGQAKIKGIPAVQHFENNQQLWKVTYTIQFKEEGWNLFILDQGRYQAINDNADPDGAPLTSASNRGKITPIVDAETGEPISDPVLLDGNGFPLQGPDAQPVFLKDPGGFKIYKRKPFAKLNLPEV